MSGMSFELSEDQELIRKSVRELAARLHTLLRRVAVRSAGSMPGG